MIITALLQILLLGVAVLLLAPILVLFVEVVAAATGRSEDELSV